MWKKCHWPFLHPPPSTLGHLPILEPYHDSNKITINTPTIASQAVSIVFSYHFILLVTEPFIVNGLEIRSNRQCCRLDHNTGVRFTHWYRVHLIHYWHTCGHQFIDFRHTLCQPHLGCSYTNLANLYLCFIDIYGGINASVYWRIQLKTEPPFHRILNLSKRSLLHVIWGT